VCGRQITLVGGEDVDDLAVLVDRPVQVNPPASNLDISFIDEPPISRSVPTGPGGVDQQWGEPLNPPVYGHVIDRDAALGQ
jgi:hypothetical protein